MRKTMFALSMLSFLALGSVSASAQTTSATSAARVTKVTNPAGTHSVMYKERTQYDFDADEVEGTTLNPNGDFVDGRTGIRFESLLKPRVSFQAEMIKSVDSM